jgi:hypothetical protein
MLVISLMLIDMNTTMLVFDGIHGVALLSEVLHISHGFGQLGIMK